MTRLGASFTISLPEGPTRLFKCPPGPIQNLFLSISPCHICLWHSTTPLHLLSYISRPPEFLEESAGGYIGLHSWTSEDPTRIFVRTGNGMEAFEMHECPAQLPIGAKGNSWFLVFDRSARIPAEGHFDPEIKGNVEGDDIVLSEYFHSDYAKWLPFSPEVRVPSNCEAVASNPSSQLLAISLEGVLEVHRVSLGEMDNSSWSVKGEYSALKWSVDELYALGNGKLTVFSCVGQVLAEIESKGTDFVLLDSSVVLSEDSLLRIIQLQRQCGQLTSINCTLDYAIVDQVSLFRPEHMSNLNLRWETVDIPLKCSQAISSPDGRWLCCFGSQICIFDRRSLLWKYTSIIGLVKNVHFMASGLVGVHVVSQSRYFVRLIDPESPNLATIHDIELDRQPAYLSVGSSTNHLVAMFPDLTAYIYYIERVKSSVRVSIVLNLSLRQLNSDKAVPFTPLTRWQIDLFESQSLASPSETDLRRDPAPVSIENIVFLQGDCLFTVTIRPASAGPTVNALTMEASGVEWFFLKSVADELWLIAIVRGEVKLRRWPFVAKPDLTISLPFAVGGFYPLLQGGMFIGADPSDTLLLAPKLVLFYLDLQEWPRLRQVFASSGEQSMMMEYVLFELTQMNNRLKAAQLLEQLHKMAASLLPRAMYVQALVRFARKCDLEEAKWIFAHSAPADQIFTDCLANAEIGTAAQLLMLRLVTGEEERVPVLKLVDAALEAEEYKLVGDVLNFVKTIWPPSDVELLVQ